MRRHISRSQTLFVGLVFTALVLLLVPAAQVDHLRAQAYSGLLPVLHPFAKHNVQVKPASFIQNQSNEQTKLQPQVPQAPPSELLTQLEQERSRNAMLMEQLAKIRARPEAPQLPNVPASIFARKDLWQETIYALDKGEAEGVKLNAGVLYGRAVLGRIVSTGSHASCMALLTHKGVSVAARLVDSRHEGVLHGTKETAAETEDGERLCRMIVVGREINVKPGEHIVTSGFDGTFPAGLWLGDALSVKKIGDVQWEVLVRPACNENCIESVYVLTVTSPEVPWPMRSTRGEVRKEK